MVDTEKIFGTIFADEDMTFAARMPHNSVTHTGLFEYFLDSFPVFDLNKHAGILAK